MLDVLILPPIVWRKTGDGEEAPDERALPGLLAAEGIKARVLDPYGRPWNPLARAHPLLRGIDPLRFAALLARRHVDVVLGVFEAPMLLPVQLRRLLPRRTRLVMWDLGLSPGWRLRERLQAAIIPHLDAVLVLGRNQVADVAARWPGPLVRAIGHSIDTDFWRPPAASADAPGEEVGGYVLAVGDDEGRDYPTLLEAAALAGVRLVIRSGRVDPATVPAGASVRWLRERCSFAALRRLYAGADIVVVPLRDRAHAGGVSALLEAAAMGRALVVSDSTGVRDWAIDGQTCVVVPCGDVAAMAAALRRLTDDAGLRGRLGAQARRFAETTCGPKVFAGRLAEALRTVSATGR